VEIVAKPSEIILHLRLHLPRHTDLFTETLDVDTATITDHSKITVITNTPHGLTTGNVVVVSSGILHNSIVSANEIVGTNFVRFTLADTHDFTTTNSDGEPQTVSLRGFSEQGWNTEHEIVLVEDVDSFAVEIPVGVTIPVVLTGNEIALENRSDGVIGNWAIEEISSTEFNITITNAPSLPFHQLQPIDKQIENFNVFAKSRIVVAADITRAEAMYTKVQNSQQAWLFLIMMSHDISRDRNTFNDSIATFTDQDEMLLLTIQNFSTAVFLDTSNSLSGAAAHEVVYGDLYEALNKTLFGYRSPIADFSRFLTVAAGHGPGTYNTSYYTHVYDWQLSQYINRDFGFSDTRDVAFRYISYDLHPFKIDEPDIFKTNIDLLSE
jgi:hypothetical protein